MKVSEIVVERILAEMQKGTIPWERPWIIIPRQNLVTRKPYSGVNRFLLADDNEEYYLSFKQIRDLGGRLKKGSKAKMVIFWKPLQVENTKATDEVMEGETPATERKIVPILRYYRVFRLSDVEGLVRPETGKENPKIEKIEEFIARIGPKIEYGGSSAHYNPKEDKVCMPEIGRFETTEKYYATLLHEVIHMTGHESRLKRFSMEDKHDYHKEYGREELVAELGSAILCHWFGIDLPEHNAGYLQGWIEAVKGDRNLLFGACSRAERAIAYLGVKI